MSTLNNFESEFLDAHNHYRRLHGVQPLRLSRELCNYATNWANTIAAKNIMQHNPQQKYGENIYWASGATVNGKDPVKSWYDEIKQYRFSKPGFTSGTGHFTQVVWAASTEVGVGVVKRGCSTWVVANYSPAGNMMGSFKENVLPPK